MTYRLTLFIAIANLALCVTASAQPVISRPANLDDFVNVNNYASLQAAIEDEAGNGGKIYLPPGTYTVDGPITLNRTTPLFLFGVSPGVGTTGHGTVIHWNVATQAPPLDDPLFVVQRVPRLSIWGIHMRSMSAINGVRAVQFVNSIASIFEIQESTITSAIVDIKGPVLGLMQQVQIGDIPGMSNVDGLILDHPAAQLYLIGVGGGRHDYHFHQKRGHLEVYGLTTGHHGISDILIDSPSPQGAHILAAIRSEGTKSQDPSRLLTVSPSNLSVDVVVKSSSLGQNAAQEAPLISYNAAGTLWVLGCGGGYNVSSIVDGVAPNSTIVAIGNVIYGGALARCARRAPRSSPGGE